MACFLVIDDDNTMRQLMAAALESGGHRVVQAAGGQESQALFARGSVDVVVTDIVMPSDSLDLVLELHARHPAVPFIVVSGLGPQAPRTLEIARILGTKHVLGKPFRLADLLAVTDNLLADLNIPPSPPSKKRG